MYTSAYYGQGVQFIERERFILFYAVTALTLEQCWKCLLSKSHCSIQSHWKWTVATPMLTSPCCSFMHPCITCAAKKFPSKLCCTWLDHTLYSPHPHHVTLSSIQCWDVHPIQSTLYPSSNPVEQCVRHPSWIFIPHTVKLAPPYTTLQTAHTDNIHTQTNSQHVATTSSTRKCKPDIKTIKESKTKEKKTNDYSPSTP